MERTKTVNFAEEDSRKQQEIDRQRAEIDDRVKPRIELAALKRSAWDAVYWTPQPSILRVIRRARWKKLQSFATDLRRRISESDVTMIDVEYEKTKLSQLMNKVWN